MGGALEGAERTSRDTMLWHASRLSPDQIINRVKEEADQRGREMVTNDGYAQGVVDTYRDNIVGRSIASTRNRTGRCFNASILDSMRYGQPKLKRLSKNGST